MQQRLTRSRHDRMLGGVCGGLARYFDLDPTIVRLVMLLLIFTAISPFIYVVLWLITPEDKSPAPPALHTQPQQWMPPVGMDPRQQQPVAPPATPAQPSQHGPFAYTDKTIQMDPQQFQQAYSATQTAEPQQAPHAQYQPYAPPVPGAAPQRRRGSNIGMALIIIGGIIFAGQIGLDEIFLPIVMIALGLNLLFRHRKSS